MKERSNTGANAAYTPNIDAPAKNRHSRRAVVGLLLTLVLPPVGLAYLWRLGVFRARGRMLLTVLATVEMALICIWMLPSEQPSQAVPIPAAPPSVTQAPDDGVVSALSNLDELLAQRQAERDAAAGITPTPMATDNAAYLAEQEAIYNTIVYSVYGNGARYYHSGPVCNTQSNRRELTVRQALEEGMGACPECNPPIPSVQIINP